MLNKNKNRTIRRTNRVQIEKVIHVDRIINLFN